MGTTIEDIQYEEAWCKFHQEIVMKNAAISQCIYVFVEGESEETAVPILLDRLNIDMEDFGIVVANYNGIGNLGHSIRLLGKTLSHDRPVIITFDNDKEGKRIIGTVSNPIFTEFPIPLTPVVTYSDGHAGGSFEESFSPETFIRACFTPELIGAHLSNMEVIFRSCFDNARPWFSQVAQFIQSNGGQATQLNKPKIAEYMAEHCDPIPDTYIKLSEKLIDLRAQNPIKHPEDVDVPR